jgi:hypothetical protein
LNASPLSTDAVFTRSINGWTVSEEDAVEGGRVKGEPSTAGSCVAEFKAFIG